ncbi:MAG: hypothetical protein PHS62_01945 [Patescibacteria group bacterium]|nr:hypothetical protein [Patescibacteria group bacterium]
MLVLKQMSPKKLAVCIAIIIVMLSGTGVMIYQNNKTTGQDAALVSGSQQDILTPQTGAGSLEAEPQAQEIQPDTSSIGNNSEIDLTIFQSEKFKALKENVLIMQSETEKGKRDPFKPN